MWYPLLVSLVLLRLCNQLCSSGVVLGVACVWSIGAESLPSIQLRYRSGWKSLTKGSMDIFTMSLLHVHYRKKKEEVNKCCYVFKFLYKFQSLLFSLMLHAHDFT